MLGTCISLLSAGQNVIDIGRAATFAFGKAAQLFNGFAGVSTGSDVQAAVRYLAQSGQAPQKLGPNMLYAPHWHQALGGGQQWSPPSLSDMARLMQPVAAATGAPVLYSAPAPIPAAFASGVAQDPHDLFLQVQPLNQARQPSGDLMGVLFNDGRQPLIGWQKRGMLSALLSSFSESGRVVRPSTNLNLVLKVLEKMPKTKGFYVTPSIPAKLNQIRLKHRVCDEGETILAFVDLNLSWLGGGNYVVFTDRGIRWRNDDGARAIRGVGGMSYSELAYCELKFRGIFTHLTLHGGKAISTSGASSSTEKQLQDTLERLKLVAQTGHFG